MNKYVLLSGTPLWKRVGVFLEAIKFEHSVFALPFAILATFISAGGWPGLTDFVWVIFEGGACRLDESFELSL